MYVQTLRRRPEIRVYRLGTGFRNGFAF